MAFTQATFASNSLAKNLKNASLEMPHSYSKFDVDFIHKITDNLNLEEIATTQDISEAVDFYLHFHPIDLGLFIVNFEKRHPKLFELLPELRDELFLRAAHLEYSPDDKDSSLVTSVYVFYEKSGNIPAFSTLAAHVYKNEILPREVLVDNFIVQLKKITTWQDMKSCQEAASSCPDLANHVLSAISTTLAAYKLLRDNKSNIKFSRGITEVLKTYRKDYGLGTCLMKKTVAVIAFELSKFNYQEKWDPCLLSKKVFSCLNNLNFTHLEQLIIKLIEWDETGLKKEQSCLDAVLLMFLGFLQSYSDKALVLSADTWLKILECFYWSENVSVTDTFFEELCDFIADPVNLPEDFPYDMPKNVLSVHLSFKNEGRSLLKDKYLVNFLDAWVSNIDHFILNPTVPRNDQINDEIETCIKLLIMAKSKAEETFSAIEIIAQILPLRKLVELFRWTMNTEKNVNKLNEKLYWRLCAVAVSGPELESFLDSCSIPGAESFYGFALWCNSRDTLSILNEKITKISCSRASNFREALVSSETLKKLASESSEKDIFHELVEGKSLRLSSLKVHRNVGRHRATQKRTILLDVPVSPANSFEAFKQAKRSKLQ